LPKQEQAIYSPTDLMSIWISQYSNNIEYGLIIGIAREDSTII